VLKYGKLDAIWANAGVSGGLVPLSEQNRRALAGSATHHLIDRFSPSNIPSRI